MYKANYVYNINEIPQYMYQIDQLDYKLDYIV